MEQDSDRMRSQQAGSNAHSKAEGLLSLGALCQAGVRTPLQTQAEDLHASQQLPGTASWPGDQAEVQGRARQVGGAQDPPHTREQLTQPSH